MQGLVDLRNNIAHGDYSAQATQADVREHVKQISEFCKRTDRKIAVVVTNQFGVPAPWRKCPNLSSITRPSIQRRASLTASKVAFHVVAVSADQKCHDLRGGRQSRRAM